MDNVLYREDEDGWIEEIPLPVKLKVCGRCEGRGVHDHPAFSNGITADEWNGPDWDDESRDTYRRGGYDVTCSECRGKRVVEVVDWDRLTDEQRAAWEKRCEEEAEYQSIVEAERRAGC